MELSSQTEEFASLITLLDKNEDRQISMEIHLLVKGEEINATTVIDPDFASCIVSVEFDHNTNNVRAKQRYDSSEFNVGLHLIININKFQQQVSFKNGQKILQTKDPLHQRARHTSTIKSFNKTSDAKFKNLTLVFCPMQCNSNKHDLSSVVITYIAVYNETIQDNCAKFLYSNFRSNMNQDITTHARKLLRKSYVFLQEKL